MISMNYIETADMVNTLISCAQSTAVVSPAMNILSIYSGTIPTVDSAYVWNPSNYTAQLLHQRGPIAIKQITSTVIPANSNGVSSYNSGITLTAALTNLIPTKTGVATWYAFHNGSANQPVIIGSCTDVPTATDTMLLNNVNLVTGSPFTVLDLTIKFIGY